jgi:hypothetical protein
MDSALVGVKELYGSMSNDHHNVLKLLNFLLENLHYPLKVEYQTLKTYKLLE